MDILNIKIENFMRLRHANMSIGPATLFAGANESGKSSTLEAVRFVCTGESPRVALKKHYSELVAEGAKSGRVTLEHGGDVLVRDVATGKLLEGDAPDHPALGFVLGAQSIAGLPDKDRRRALIDLLGAAGDAADVRARMLDRGLDADLVDETLPMLRAGWEAVEKLAQEKAREEKGAWRQVTGEVWGAQKAEGWQPPQVAPPAASLDALNEQLTANEERLQTLTQEYGAARVDHERQERNQGQREKLAERAADLKTAHTDEGKAQEQWAKAEAALREAEQAAHAGKPRPCPACGTELVVAGDALVAADAKHASAPDLDAARAQFEAAVAAWAAARARHEACASAATMLSEMDEQAPCVSSDDLAEMAKQIGTTREALAGLREQINQARKALLAEKDAEKKTQHAQRAHQRAMAYLGIAEAASPSGIPAELLGEALDPINQRLMQTAQVTGWSPTQLDAGGNITVGGARYSLCSESLRWRADAALAEALAWTTGLRLLLLDRVDVLDLPNRGKFAAWLSWLSCEYEKVGGTILCAGTFKSPPAIEDVQTWWLERGEAVARQAEAA